MCDFQINFMAKPTTAQTKRMYTSWFKWINESIPIRNNSTVQAEDTNTQTKQTFSEPSSTILSDLVIYDIIIWRFVYILKEVYVHYFY